MTIGILCAIPEELAALRERLHLEASPERHGPTSVWRGDGVVLALSGIGKVNAAAAATLLLSSFSSKAVIFSGVAGGLAPDLPVGSVLLGERMAIHDYGLMRAGEFTPVESGVIPIGATALSALTAIPAGDAALLARLADAVKDEIDHPVRLGGILTADYFLNCVETREALRARFGADAIDMESGAVNQVARAWGVPLYVIRTLSDLAGEESHLTFNEMAQMAAANSALCVTRLLQLLANI